VSNSKLQLATMVILESDTTTETLRQSRDDASCLQPTTNSKSWQVLCCAYAVLDDAAAASSSLRSAAYMISDFDASVCYIVKCSARYMGTLQYSCISRQWQRIQGEKLSTSLRHSNTRIYQYTVSVRTASSMV
jgi:hypothetical protein